MGVWAEPRSSSSQSARVARPTPCPVRPRPDLTRPPSPPHGQTTLVAHAHPSAIPRSTAAPGDRSLGLVRFGRPYARPPAVPVSRLIRRPSLTGCRPGVRRRALSSRPGFDPLGRSARPRSRDGQGAMVHPSGSACQRARASCSSPRGRGRRRPGGGRREVLSRTEGGHGLPRNQEIVRLASQATGSDRARSVGGPSLLDRPASAAASLTLPLPSLVPYRVQASFHSSPVHFASDPNPSRLFVGSQSTALIAIDMRSGEVVNGIESGLTGSSRKAAARQTALEDLLDGLEGDDEDAGQILWLTRTGRFPNPTVRLPQEADGRRSAPFQTTLSKYTRRPHLQHPPSLCTTQHSLQGPLQNTRPPSSPSHTLSTLATSSSQPLLARLACSDWSKRRRQRSKPSGRRASEPNSLSASGTSLSCARREGCSSVAKRT